MSKDRNVYAEIDGRLDRMEELIKQGKTDLVTAMRQLSEFREMVQQFTDGEVFGFALLEVIDPLLNSVESTSQPATREPIERQAKLLAADVIELGFDDDGHYDFHSIMELKTAARRLLTGVDEGPYTGRQAGA